MPNRADDLIKPQPPFQRRVGHLGSSREEAGMTARRSKEGTRPTVRTAPTRATRATMAPLPTLARQLSLVLLATGPMTRTRKARPTALLQVLLLGLHQLPGRCRTGAVQAALVVRTPRAADARTVPLLRGATEIPGRAGARARRAVAPGLGPLCRQRCGLGGVGGKAPGGWWRRWG